MKTQASRALRGRLINAAEIAALAERYGKKPSTVERWVRGEGQPPLPVKLKLEREYPDVTLHGWGVPAPDARMPRVREPAEPQAGSATPGAVISEADTLLAELRGVREELQANPDPAERLKGFEQASRIVVALGRMTGTGVQLSPRQILASPNWALIRDAIIDAIKPFGAAPLRAMSDALLALESAE